MFDKESRGIDEELVDSQNRPDCGVGSWGPGRCSSLDADSPVVADASEVVAAVEILSTVLFDLDIRVEVLNELACDEEEGAFTVISSVVGSSVIVVKTSVQPLATLIIFRQLLSLCLPLIPRVLLCIAVVWLM